MTTEDDAHMAAMEERHQHEAEQEPVAQIVPLAEAQCANEARHRAHGWGGAFGKRWCPGYIGRAGVAQPAPLARVNDVIEHGQPIPGNVTYMTDSPRREGGDPWHWRREGERFRMGSVPDDPNPGPPRTPDELGSMFSHRWPMTVVEVDPEPQPAERGLRDQLLSRWQEYATSSDVVDDAHLVRWVNALIENLGYASRRLKRAEAPESGPIALSLPQVFEVPQPPSSMTQVVTDSGRLLVRMSGDHWLDSDTAKLYVPGDQVGSGWNNLLASYGRLTDATPPREPRTWEPPDDVPTDLPGFVEVNGSRYRHAGDLTYVHEKTGGMWDWWSLRGSGLVREVLS